MLDRVTIERATAKAPDAPIAIALSGGGDSSALLHLLVEELGAARLRALVVDHGLREGSHADAGRALGFARALGVEGEILTLDWPLGPKRTQQAARRARYAALCDAARKHGARVVALAHTADDQAETVLMRAAGGSGWRGLAGIAAIAPAPVWPEGRGIRLVRPLLGARREELRALLRHRGACWIEDPANANVAFERVRVRKRLADMEAQGFDPLRLTRLADDLLGRVVRVDRAAADLIARAARFEGERIVVSRAAWDGDSEVRRRALAVLLLAAAGGERAPDAQALARLDAAMQSSDFPGATLGGAALTAAKAGVVLRRDPGALLGRADGAGGVAALALNAGEEAVWDGRLRLTMAEPGWSVDIGPNCAPVLRRCGAALSPGEAGAAASWLLADHVAHLVDAH